MGFRRYMIFAALLSCGIGATSADASTSNLSTDPKYASGFIFYCPPYELPFVEGRHYRPTDAGCVYSIPTDTRVEGEKVFMMLYRGTPGHATLLRSEPVQDTGSPTTLAQLSLIGSIEGYGSLNQGDPLFGAVVPSGPIDPTTTRYPKLTQFNAYFSSGSTTPPSENYHVLAWKWGRTPPLEYDPVIIVPGILGSWEKNGEWILDPILHAYDNLVDTLLANGYIKNKTLFTFPYDWRNSNTVTASLLKQKIEEVKAVCNCSYVDLVGHSMGGLVAGQYIASPEYGDDVDQAIFVATPFLGAPKAYKTWEAGEVDFGAALQDFIMNRIFSREARDYGYDSVLSYIQGRPVTAIQELLPPYSYLINATDLTEVPYPDGHPRNTFLEGLSLSLSRKINRSPVRASVIISDNNLYNTITYYAVQPTTQAPLWSHGEPTREYSYSGDGTVPLTSLEGLGELSKSFPGVDHTTVASTSAGYIFELLNNGGVVTQVGRMYDPLHNADYAILINKFAPSAGDFRYYADTVAEFLLRQNPLIKDILTIVLYSPVDMEIIAPDGKRLGTDTATGQIWNEVPQARYSNNPGEHEYAIILDPLPGKYQVKTVGTGDGTYTVAVGRGSSSTITITTYTGSTNTRDLLTHSLDLSLPIPTVVLATSSLPTPVTPESCVSDMQLAYKNKWITKKSIYNELVADCKLLKVLFTARDKAKSNVIRKGVVLSIKALLDRMDSLAKDKSNKPEAVQLITKNTTWFRANELK